VHRKLIGAHVTEQRRWKRKSG